MSYTYYLSIISCDFGKMSFLCSQDICICQIRPDIDNGLKICSTLALIGAIVAEFFGSPIKGMGFRISSEVGRFALDMVWAEIFVAAMAGCLFYGLIALIERRTTFWHPSQQK